MQHKSTYLFDINKLIPRPIPEQARFEEDYMDLLSRMPELVERAYELTDEARRRKRPRSINKNWFSNEMSGNLADLISAEFPEYVRLVRGTYCLNLNFEYECYVKRLSVRGLRPSYKHSNTSWANVNQKSLSAKDAAPIIFIGYSANKTNDQIRGVYAVCIKGKERLWVSDLTALAPPDALSPSVTITPTPPKAPTPEVQVGVRAKKKAQ